MRTDGVRIDGSAITRPERTARLRHAYVQDAPRQYQTKARTQEAQRAIRPTGLSPSLRDAPQAR
jgi:hypothetical protein